MFLNNIIEKLSKLATKSVNVHKHAAVLIYNGKPIEWSINKIIGNKTYHAEYAVINKYLSTRRKRTIIRKKNIKILVIRIGGYNKNKLINSKPCSYCIKYLRFIGIKKIYYSNNDGCITYENIKEIHNDHVSMAYKLD